MDSAHPPRVFISYSHDTVEHRERVWDFAKRLRVEGIDAEIDQYITAPPEGWPLWYERQIETADVVLMVCTEIYHRRVRGDEQPGQGLGVVWEALIIRQLLYDAGAVGGKFVPVLFSDASPEHIPTPIKGGNRYVVDTEDGYEALFRRLTGQPRLLRPALGTIRQFPTCSRQWSEGTRQSASSSLNLRESGKRRGLIEPVTTGALVAGALSAAVTTLAKGVLSDTARDIYNKLKNAIAAWAGHDIGNLEKNPESTARKAVITELVNEREQNERQELAALAEELVAALGDEGKARGEIPETTTKDGELSLDEIKAFVAEWFQKLGEHAPSDQL